MSDKAIKKECECCNSKCVYRQEMEREGLCRFCMVHIVMLEMNMYLKEEIQVKNKEDIDKTK